MSVRNRPKHSDCVGIEPLRLFLSGQLGCRGSEPARQPTRLKGLPCTGCFTQDFLWQSQSEQSSITRMADRHRAEVVVTAAQNSATAKALGVFSDGREAPPGGRCNRRAKRRSGKITRLYSDVRQEPPGAQGLHRDRAASAVSFRISRMADRHRAEVIVTAAQNSATAK